MPVVYDRGRKEGLQMDQAKIGSFISQCRRAKGWTQSRLAEELGITDKAVSKWETGKSMPDLSLFTQLCSLLGITLNELFAGEYIPDENLKRKSDEVLREVLCNWLGHDRKAAPPDDPEAEIMLKLRHVSKVYETESTSTMAVRHVSFEIPKGKFIGVMGASGSGKTTLLHLIASIDRPTEGSIEINGTNIVGLAEKLGISSILAKFPYEVSGGQRQRCACARAIVVNPDIILADEPTGALDSHAAKQLLNTFLLLRQEYGATILMVTHDALSASYCDRILFMHDGGITSVLDRKGQNNQAFFMSILDEMARITGDYSHVS